MAKESIIWKDIPNFEGLYRINNYGDIVNIKTNKYLKCNSITNSGYMQVELTKDKHTYYKLVHRLVAEAFIPNPDNLKTVNHKNEIKTDNSVENLEWMSQKDNNNYGSRNKRISEFRKYNQFGSNNPNAVKVLNKTTGEIFGSVREAAHKYNCNPASISSACNPADRHHNYLIKGCKWEWLKPVQ